VYCTVWPRPTMKWWLSKTNFCVIFPTFLRYTKNFKGTLAPVPISTHPTVQYMISMLTRLCDLEFIDLFFSKKFGDLLGFIQPWHHRNGLLYTQLLNYLQFLIILLNFFLKVTRILAKDFRKINHNTTTNGTTKNKCYTVY
jgi:hypothetical protein